MTLYEHLRENLNTISVLLKSGIVGGSIIRDMEIYKYYRDVRALGNSKSVSFIQTKTHYKIGRTKMYRILASMGGSV